ncbi:MAG: hypothetical protein WC767_04080 [Candidatus Paceibacterota bacterium]|jgi:hypothetical protein
MNDILKNKYFWIAVVLGLILGDIIGVSLGNQQKEALEGINATSSPYMVIATDQMAGDTVVVSEATSDVSAWLAVRENNGELLGRILGAHRMDAGSVRGLVVDLLRPTTANLMYAVVMYRDDGDGAFDSKLDALIEEAGAPIMSRFVAR